MIIGSDDTGALLLVKALRVGWPGRDVLNGLSMTLDAGEVYALLGPNGAGKTTLIKALCGRIRPQSGLVQLDGLDIRAGGVRHRIGLVPQMLAVYSHLSPRENLSVFARLAGLPRCDVRAAVDAALDATLLRERADDLVRTLSGGYQRRVNIAAAILHKPRLLILDEPTVGVDVDARACIHQVLRDLRAQGMTVLLTTHDLEQADVLSDRVGFLFNGTLIDQGAPEALLKRHFGDSRELVVVLRQLPDAGQTDWLGRQGFSATQTPSIWTRRQQPGTDSAEHVSERLQQQGLAIREIRLRHPDLNSLFLKLTGREAGV